MFQNARFLSLAKLAQVFPKQSTESFLLPRYSTPLTKCNFSQVQPVTKLSEDEQMMKDSVSKLANQVIAPFVKKMDNQQYFEPEVVEALFSNGLMGIEIDSEYGGTGSSFFSSIITVEELAKVDPAVSVFCDIQNTLINTLIRNLGTTEQKEKYLTRLSQDMVNDLMEN